MEVIKEFFHCEPGRVGSFAMTIDKVSQLEMLYVRTD